MHQYHPYYNSISLLRQSLLEVYDAQVRILAHQEGLLTPT